MGQAGDSLREIKLVGRSVYRGRILDLEVDQVRLPSGAEATREVVRHQGASVVVPILEGRRVVFVRQHRYPSDEVLLELPAGKVDPGENAETCAVRELAEETGWHATEIQSMGSFLTTPGFSDEELFAFAATRLEETSDHRPDPDETIEIVTMTVDEALEACLDGGIRDGKTIAALFLARLRGLI